MTDSSHLLDPPGVVKGQLDAYNARDIDLFMSFWTQDAEFIAFPDTLLAKGHEQIRERHVARFQEPNLYGKLINRMSVGNIVVDQEVVTRTFPEGPGQVDVIGIYEVEDGAIKKAWFKMGTPILDKLA
jgi:hypothetical protein